MRGRDGVHQPVPYACFSPSDEAVVGSGTRTIALRKIAPRRTGPQHSENAVQHAPVVYACTPRGLLGSSGSITRHSKSDRSYRLMPMLNQSFTRWESRQSITTPVLAVAAISSHAEVKKFKLLVRGETNVDITL